VVGKDLVLGLRPEHITEPRHNGRADGRDFTVTLDVVEPMGMETMVFFTVNGTEICGRVEPSSAGDAGATMRLYANIDHMHLVDPTSGLVI
jgi:multiple sugar transport system ATP-binding protein